MSVELKTYTDAEKSYEVLDVFSDVLTENGLRFAPQQGMDLGIWDHSNSRGDELFINDETVDDLITYLEYYKHKKMEEGTWRHKQ